MKRWKVFPATAPIKGVVSVQGDKSIGHRALLLGALADGHSVVRGISGGEDNRSTRRALEQMGVRFETTDDGALRIHGVGLFGLSAPSGVIDCGNSGTTMRLLAGLLSAQSFDSVLVGDASLSRRPMARVARPLRARGAKIDGEFDAERNDEVPPLRVRALPKGARLAPLELRMEVASAQVKSALLLSGLSASGPTALTEPVVSRDHTERMLQSMGAPVQTLGGAVLLDPEGWNQRLDPMEITIPGDPSSAMFLLVAAHVVPGGRVKIRNVCANPTRTGGFDVLRDMGGDVVIVAQGAFGEEPVADVYAGGNRASELRSAAKVGGELAVRSIDEVPALVAAAAACPRGVSEFRELRELRVKETDRIAALSAMLRAFAVEHEVLPDGMRVQGGCTVRGGGTIASRGDHRIAMASAVLALAADGPTVIEDVACVDTSFPGFAAEMTRLGAKIETEEVAG